MRILVLGTGSPQADLMRRLTADHEVHALSNLSSGPGLRYADFFEQIDIGDEAAVCSYAKQHHIDLIYTVGSDLGMVTSAVVSHKLGLPGFVSPEMAQTCHNKDLMRSRLKELNGNPAYRVLGHGSALNGFCYPFIIKPVDSQGQRGVYLIKDEQDYRDKFPVSIKYSASNRLIAEEFIEGPEVSVHTYSIGGELCFFQVSDRIVWPDLPGGVIHKHRIPSEFTNDESRERIRDLVVAILKVLGLENGPAYFQIKLQGGIPKLVEVTPRLDGCHMWRLIQYATGVDLLEITLLHLLGETSEDMTAKKASGTWVLEFMCERPGRVFNKNQYVVKHALFHEWDYEDGEVVRPVNTFMEKCGYQIYSVQ